MIAPFSNSMSIPAMLLLGTRCFAGWWRGVWGSQPFLLLGVGEQAEKLIVAVWGLVSGAEGASFGVWL